MPETIASSLITIKNQTHSTAPWVWIYDADLDGTNILSAAGHDVSVTYNSRIYSPFPIAVQGLEKSSSGDLPTPVITVSNLSREVVGYLEAGGILDRRVKISLMNTTDTSSIVDFGEWVVLDAAVSMTAASFRLGSYQLFDAPFPSRRQMRVRCDNAYGGRECGYDTTLSNLISAASPSFDPTTCDFSIFGGNGCVVHGDNEVAHGRYRNHPKRVGSHLGIAKGPARV